MLAFIFAAALASPQAPWPTPPFAAWLNLGGAYVRLDADASSPAVGLLNLGDQVLVKGCAPTCDDARAWALLEPMGAVRMSFLSASPSSEMAVALSAHARFVYGTVRGGGAPMHIEPDAHALVVKRLTSGHVLAFRDDPALLAAGWLRRPSGGFVPVSRVRLATPSAFSGEPRPAAPITFVVQTVTQPDATTLPRYARLPARDINAHTVTTDAGVLARAAVRLAVRRPRPSEIGGAEKWVHVDLDEQVLTAYEGDVMVYATLVSSGKDDSPTPTGLFRVWQKLIHGTMHGRPDDPYYVEEVPYSLYFNESMALHGSFWHDVFGARVSHGCVNLSLADAAWLFAWAPPELPSGWHAIMPLEAELPSLWVQIEKRATPPTERLDAR